MTELVWGIAGERYYETGVDRGVLYPKTGLGTVWDGLISVSESPTGGEARPYYTDGFKYLNVASSEEFAATLEAFSSPAAFAKCDGTLELQAGLFITQQPRESFGLSYRTKIGNDTDGIDHGHKLHLVYNALASPSERKNSTLSDSPEPMTFSWEISTVPPIATGFKPTAHFVIDSRKVDPTVLSNLEALLYGTESSSPALPTVTELIALF